MTCLNSFIFIFILSILFDLISLFLLFLGQQEVCDYYHMMHHIILHHKSRIL